MVDTRTQYTHEHAPSQKIIPKIQQIATLAVFNKFQTINSPINYSVILFADIKINNPSHNHNLIGGGSQ